MKVLTNPKTGSALVFPRLGDKFLGLDGVEADGGEVAEYSQSAVFGQAVEVIARRDREARDKLAPDEREGVALSLPVDMENPFRFTEAKELKADLRWIAKALADVPVGTEVGLRTTARGYGLDVPEGARPDRSAALKAGSHIAVGPRISPKALMNARGVVKSLKGSRAMVEFDEGDLSRVERATGKKFARTTSVPRSSLEVID